MFDEQIEAVERPAYVKDRHLEYLDALRESGITNMYGAAPYVKDAFKRLSAEQARGVLVYWMRTFAARHPEIAARRRA